MMSGATHISSNLLPVYRRSDIIMARGEGVYLFDDSGKRYLDFATGIAVNALGHCHPHVTAALKAQADRLWLCSNLYRNEPLERFAERLNALSFADKIFFCSTGTEAVECGIKMIRRHQFARGETKRTRIITMQNGFHGRSLACISAGGNAVAREGFAPLLDGFDPVAFNDVAALEAAVTEHTAGILLEPIQGEGGIFVASQEYMAAARRLCDAHGLLLFLDEVQCGIGRSGHLFAYEAYGILPDIVSVAKGIGNGFPLAATLATDHAATGMTPGSHGSTYGGNPLAMAVGNAVLDILEKPDLLKNVRARGVQLKNGLQKLVVHYPALLKDVRGNGLMLGLQVTIPHREWAAEWRDMGLLASPAYHDTIRLLPPLTVEKTHIDDALHILQSACEAKS